MELNGSIDEDKDDTSAAERKDSLGVTVELEQLPSSHSNSVGNSPKATAGKGAHASGNIVHL